jgi:FkbM family methyltransferase
MSTTTMPPGTGTLTRLYDAVMTAYETVQRNPYHFFPQWFQDVTLDTLMRQPVVFLGQENAYGQVMNNLHTIPDINPIGTVVFDKAGAWRPPHKAHPLIHHDALADMAQLYADKGTPIWAINFGMSGNTYQYWQRFCAQQHIRLLDWAEALRLPSFYAVQSGQVTDLWTGLKDRIPEALATADYYDDVQSVETLYRLLLYRLTLDRRVMWPCQTGWQSEYFYTGLYDITTKDRFADVGAFNGDTLGRFSLATQGQFAHYTGFEPDPGTFVQLSQYVAQRPEYQGRVTLERAGVSDTEDSLSFFQGWGGGSRLRHTDETIAGDVITVPCVTLDTYFSDKAPPTLIKYDVEGAELSGLKGAQQLIEAHAPHLAVCAYHLPTDVLTLPAWLRELPVNYTLQLRHHANSHWDTVLYASRYGD